MAELPSLADKVEKPYRFSVSAMIIRMSSVSSTTRTFFMPPGKWLPQTSDPLVEALGRLMDDMGGIEYFVRPQQIAAMHQRRRGADDAGQRRGQFARQQLRDAIAQLLDL